jgi:hypothetical protein
VPELTSLSISMIDSRKGGVPTAVCRDANGREFYLHSRYDPIEEARFLVKDIPCRERTLVVVLGFGLGYHVKELLQRIPRSSHIVVIEPDSVCLSRMLREKRGAQAGMWMDDNRVHFLTCNDPGAVPLHLADATVRWRLLSLDLFTHLPTSLTAESFYRVLLTCLPQEFPASYASRLNFLNTILENSLGNFWANLPHSWDAVSIQALRGVWRARPALIVSAGPSLTSAFPLLCEAGNRPMLLAAGSAGRMLMERQIRPDLVVSIDPFAANAEHFKNWDTTEVPLVYYHRIHRDILASYAGPRFYFVAQDDPPLPLCGSAGDSAFLQGGSVAFSALQVAHHLGANPIIFVGQDFAFAEGHTHASGSVANDLFDERNLPRDYLRVPGVVGKPVVTSRLLYSYLLYMQDYLLGFARRKPEVRHINTSPNGAMIQGMEHLPLDQALAANRDDATPSARACIAAVIDRNQPIPRTQQRASVEKWSAELDRVLARVDASGEFGRLFAALKGTSLYAQVAQSYEDVFYLHEARHRENATFGTRFRAHLEFVREELRKTGRG